jgi:hypothetical protein
LAHNPELDLDEVRRSLRTIKERGGLEAPHSGTARGRGLSRLAAHSEFCRCSARPRAAPPKVRARRQLSA